MSNGSCTGEYYLRWTNHDSLLHGACNNLLTSERFADVNLYCEGGPSLKCHRFILSACSSYFERILSEITPACQSPVVIVLRNVPYDLMSLLLQFMYNGEMTAEEGQLSSLIEVAQSLCIKGIGDYDNSNGIQEEKSKYSSQSRKQQKSELSKSRKRSSLPQSSSLMNQTCPIDAQDYPYPPEATGKEINFLVCMSILLSFKWEKRKDNLEC